MPEYTFRCEKCDFLFSKILNISEYDSAIEKIQCENCKSKNIYREYKEDNIHGHVNEIRTLGQLAEANTKKYGSELTNKMRESHKTKREIGMKELPQGMKRVRDVSDFTNNYSKDHWKKKKGKK